MADRGGATGSGVAGTGGVTSTGGSSGTGGSVGSGGTGTSGSAGAGGAGTGGSSTGGAGGVGTGGSSGRGGAGSGGSSATGGAGKGGASGTGGSSTGGSSGTGGAAGFLDAKETELKAFPTAEGYGRYSKGGRAGKVVEVTNLNDSGAGSLRAAVEMTGARTIVFTVGGVIALKSKLLITGSLNNSAVTVAGQTAPGKGIAIRNFAFGMTGGADVIMRFVRLKVGGSSMTAMDGMGMASGRDNSIYRPLLDQLDHRRSVQLAQRPQHHASAELISEALERLPTTTEVRPITGNAAARFAASIARRHRQLPPQPARALRGPQLEPRGRARSRDRRNYAGASISATTSSTTGATAPPTAACMQLNFVNNYYKPGPATTCLHAAEARTAAHAVGRSITTSPGNVMDGHFDDDRASSKA